MSIFRFTLDSPRSTVSWCDVVSTVLGYTDKLLHVRMVREISHHRQCVNWNCGISFQYLGRIGRLDSAVLVTQFRKRLVSNLEQGAKPIKLSAHVEWNFVSSLIVKFMIHG